jgi:3',5'-cyclic AMP phosphodiesterase CpdA
MEKYILNFCKSFRTYFTFIFLLYFLSLIVVQPTQAQKAASNPKPTPIPDRIILTWKTEPTISQAVTWRTDKTVNPGLAEIAIANPSPQFVKNATTIEAETTPLKTENGLAHYHSVNFTNLQKNTLYAYRVGRKDKWSEWFQFMTASTEPESFSFIYFGDGQNNILSMWSRTVRAAFSDAPKARFIIHAGDLVSSGNSDTQWGEWFLAGGWINAMVPSIPSPGNHDYPKNLAGQRNLSKHWQPQFTLPDYFIPGLEETAYSIDFQGARIISLNSNRKIQEQADWLDTLLENNPNTWTVITFHHPIFSSSEGRDNKKLRALWKPIFDKYNVDLVLQGHDHTYARGRNLPFGVNKNDESGPVYVVSVSGPKMYTLTENRWMDRAAENTQLYQIISIHRNKLIYEAKTVTGELYDSFEIIKNKFNNKIPELPERRLEKKE